VPEKSKKERRKKEKREKDSELMTRTQTHTKKSEYVPLLQQPEGLPPLLFVLSSGFFRTYSEAMKHQNCISWSHQPKKIQKQIWTR
jgi:hypothetical protein